MTMIDWTTEIAKRCSHLAGLGKLPPPVAQHSALQALAVLSITTDNAIEHALTPDSTMPIWQSQLSPAAMTWPTTSSATSAKQSPGRPKAPSITPFPQPTGSTNAALTSSFCARFSTAPTMPAAPNCSLMPPAQRRI